MSAALVVLIVVLPLVALGLPNVLVDDGLNGLSPRREAAARAALRLARSSACIDNPIGRGLVLATRVSTVRAAPAGGSIEPALRSFEVTVDLYTLFGLRLDTVTVGRAGCADPATPPAAAG